MSLARVNDAAIEAVAGPSVWYGSDLACDDAWIHQLTAPELDEIAASLSALEAQDRPIIAIERDDFPLPTLGPRLTAMRDADQLNGRGFALLRGLPVDSYSMKQAAIVFWGLGRWIGTPRSQNGKGHLLGHVRDLGYDVADPSVRIYQTTSRQTYHTDSCDVVALLCLQTAKAGGLSSLVSSMTIHNEMLRRRPDLLALLYEPFATDRRGEIPPGQKPWFDIPVFNRYQGYLSAIYARQYINSAQRFPEAPRLTAAQIEALDLFDDLANDHALRLDMEFRRGDVQFVCNHGILHDRTAFEDWPEPERKRHLLRLWLCTPVGRPLPPAYAARYGSTTIGDRGGIVLDGVMPVVPLQAE